MNEEELLRRLAALRKHGASEQELAAFADEWDKTHPSISTTAKPDVLTGEGMGGSAPGGNNPFGNAARTGMGMVLGSGVGGGVGAGVAALLPKRIAAAMLGRVLAGAAGGSAGGMASRLVTTPGGLKERGLSAVNPRALTIDAALGGVLGGVLGGTLKASKQAAHDLGETIPRVTRKGVPSEVAKIAGVSVEEPLVAQQGMTSALNRADTQRFAFLNTNGGGVVTDPKVLGEYDQLRSLFPEVESIALRSAQLDAAKNKLPFDPDAVIKQPTLQYLHYFKQALAKPEALAETRALAGKPLARGDLRSIKQLASGFRDVLKNYSVDYKNAVEASQADRAAIGALEAGTKVAKPTSKSLGTNPTSPAAISQTAAGLNTPEQIAAQRAGFVGELAQAEDPLKRLNTGVVRDKVRALLGTQSLQDLDKATTPWENAIDLSKRLQSSGIDLATRFGSSGALGGKPEAARTAFGAQLFNTLARGHRIRQAKDLIPMFQTHAPGPDTEDFLNIFKELAKARAARAPWVGGIAGAVAGGSNQQAVAPWERP